MAEDAAGRLLKGMAGLKERAKTIEELTDNAVFYAKERPLLLSDKAARLVDDQAAERLGRLRADLDALAVWSADAVEEAARAAAARDGVKLGRIAQPLRAALTGATASPGLFEVMEVLGRAETLARLDDALKNH